MSSRRDFLKTMFTVGTLAAIPNILSASVGAKNLQRIVILHTNDTHSQIDPLPSTHHRFSGMGGYAARAALVNKIRGEGYPVLLFDSGDIFQGTPYYNMYSGEVEIKLMSDMNYSGACIGNHEFDKGLDALAEVMRYATFPFLSSNYTFNHQMLKKSILPYKIYEFGKIKIGVFALSPYPFGLIDSGCFGDTEYKDPVSVAAKYAYMLKKEKKCNLVVCLSHQGYKTEDKQIGDYEMAKQSKNIDIILGGHSHTLLSKPVFMYNSDGKQVIITQNAYAGVCMSRIDCYFSYSGNLLFSDSHTNKI